MILSLDEKLAEARYTAEQVLLHRREADRRTREGLAESSVKWLRIAQRNHTAALAHQLLSLPERERPDDLKALLAQVWL